MTDTNMALAIQIKADMRQAHAAISSLAGDVNSVNQALQTVSGQGAQAAQTFDRLSNSAALAGAGYSRAAQGVRSISEQLSRMQTLVATIGSLTLGISGLRDVIQMADGYGQMASRIKLATASADEYAMVQERLLQTANATYRPLAETQEVYLRTSSALKALGYSTSQALDTTSSLSYLFVTNAASSEKASNAITAFGKALAKGKIDAEGWESMLSAVPSLVDKIAETSGKSADEIRRLGVEGKLALTDLTEGLRQSMTGNLEDVAKMPVTVADAFNNLRNSLQAFLGESAPFKAAIEGMTTAIGFLADNMGNLGAGAMATMSAAFGVGIVRMGMAGKAALQLALAEREAAAAALREAEAEMAAAQAALAHERASVGLGTAVTGVAAAETRAATAAMALATAQTRAAGALAAIATAGRGILSFLGGPVGLAVTVATTAAGWLLFRDNTKAAESGLADLSLSAKQATEKIKALSDVQRSAALNNLKNEAAAAGKAYANALKEAGNSVKLNPIFSWADEVIAASRTIRAELKSQAPDWDRIARLIDETASLTDKQRTAWLDAVSAAREAGNGADTLAGRYAELKSSADAATVSTEGLIEAQRKQANDKALDDIAKAQAALNNLRDPSALGKWTRENKAAWEAQGITPQNIALMEQILRAQDAFNASRKAGSGRKTDVYGQQMQQMAAALAEAQQKLEQAQRGVAESTDKSLTKFQIWLKTAKEAQTLTAAQAAALEALASQTDAAAAATKKLTEARERDKRITEGTAELNIALAEQEGRAQEAALLRFAKQYKQLRADFESAGDLAGLAKLGDLENYTTAVAGLQQVEAALTRVRDLQGREEQSIQTEMETGLITEIEGRQRLLAIHQQTYAELAKLRPELERLSALPGAVGEQATAALAALDDQAKRLKSTTTLLDETLQNGLKTGLSEAISGLAKGTMSLKDAVKSLANTIIESLAKLYANEMAQSLFSGMKGSGGGLFGWLGGLFGSAGLADGGRIPGRSPHDRADNLLFWGTAGEYVTRRKITRQPGAINFLEDFNAIGMPAILKWARALPLPRRADGGMLPAPPSFASPLAGMAGQMSSGPVINFMVNNTMSDQARVTACSRESNGMSEITVLIEQVIAGDMSRNGPITRGLGNTFGMARAV